MTITHEGDTPCAVAPMKPKGEANDVVVQMLRQPIDTAVIYMLQYAP